MAVLTLTLAGGRTATLSLRPDSTAFGVGEDVASYDLGGRPYALVREGSTYRRALDGRLLQKGGPGERLRRVLASDDAAAVLEAARADAHGLRAEVERAPDISASHRHDALQRLRTILAMDRVALAYDSARFASTYRPVGMLPPDQYLSLVVQATEGCSWNACTFCALYRTQPFHAKDRMEFGAHLDDVRAFFGPALALRRSLFLGDANALCTSHERVLALMRDAVRAFPETQGLHAFVDAWTGRRKRVREYRDYAEVGLRRVYLGVESGDPKLLAWLNKPGGPEEALELVETLRAAGVAVGVIVMAGVGGRRFAATHQRATAALLQRFALREGDLLYVSDFVEEPGLDYARRAREDGVLPLDAEGYAQQRQAFFAAAAGTGARLATYDVREFVY